MRKHILDFLKKRWLHYAVGIICIIISTMMQTSIPQYLGKAIDALSQSVPDTDFALYCAGMMAFLAAAGFAVKMGWRILIIGSGRSVEFYIREKLFEKLQTMPASFFNENKTGDLISRAIVDVLGVRRIFAMVVVQAVDITVSIGVSMGFILGSVDLLTTVVVLAPVPFILVSLVFLRRAIRRRFLRLQEAIAEISDKVQENTMGIRIIKGFAQEEVECEEFSRLSEQKTRAEMRMGQLASMLSPLTSVAFGISFTLFLILGAGMVASGSLSVGSYVAVNSYIGMIVGPVSMVSRLMEIWQSGAASVQRLDHIFAAPSEDDSAADCSITAVEPTIELRDLTFSYQPHLPPALQNITLTIPAGGSLGVMGKTGSGKTTLASLLLRLYPVAPGMLFIGGHDANKVPLPVLRSMVGYVPQDQFLFSDTITHNISFYDPAITEEMAKDAAAQACIRTEIEEFPDGFETMLGERGVTLSGGQKQRVAIARALVKRAPLVILDDCLSAVDAATETAILQHFTAALAQTTRVIISHRVSSVQCCDTIIFLENGRIIEQGSHEQLLALNGHYAALYREQNDAQTAKGGDAQ